MGDGPRTSLDLTHVLYDDSSLFSLALALVTLTPILLMPAYAALALYTRELTIIIMWAGQLLCEAFNLALKRTIKQERPSGHAVANGYGFPSSHGQYMGFFASFLICHLYFRQRFTMGTGNRPLDSLGRLVLYSGILLWAVSVAYSRYYLQYHTPRQILWGFFIGVLFGLCTYIITELIPARRPYSTLGKVRRWVLVNRLSVWLEIRDGWAVWGDAGRTEEWKRWRDRWERECRRGD